MAVIDHYLESITIRSTPDDLFLLPFLSPLIMQVLDKQYTALGLSIFLLASHGRFSLSVPYSPSLIQAELFLSE